MSSTGNRIYGQFKNSNAPYGYIIDPDDKSHFIIDTECAQVVSDIFRWCTKDKMSMSAINRKLIDMKILSPSAQKMLRTNTSQVHTEGDNNANLWSQSTVRAILVNQMYLGHRVQKHYQRIERNGIKYISPPKSEGIIIQNNHEPIITQELFDLAIQRREHNVNLPYTQKKSCISMHFFMMLSGEHLIQIYSHFIY